MQLTTLGRRLRASALALAGAGVLALAGCGGGGGGAVLQGTFLDAPVDGLTYTGNLGSSGTTSGGGKFSYREGEQISFTIGGVVIGTASGTDTVTPLQLSGAGNALGPYAVRVLRLLQSLDSDDDPSNGITISSASRQALSDFVDLAKSDDAALARAVARARPGRSPVSEDDALRHFADTVVNRGLQLGAPAASTSRAVTLTLLHTNDTHSRIESFADSTSGLLQGGVARRKTLIEQVRSAVGGTHTLLVDAGDFSQGTVFYNAWEASESIMAMNDMRYDVATLGNHEFDLGPARLARALKGESITIAGSSYATEKPIFPMVATNLDVSAEPALKGLLRKYVVVERGGEKYGVLGVVTEDLPVIANLGGKARVLDYATSVNAASALLRAQGINKIVLLSHYGYAVDIARAKDLVDVDVIVSAHDHALLGDAAAINSVTSSTSPTYAGQGSLSVGAYPTARTDRNGQPVLVVSAFEWGRWLGRIDLGFDAAGRIVGHRAAPMYVDGRSVAEDSSLAAKVADYKAPVSAFSSVIIGQSSVSFSASRGALSPAFTAGVRTAEMPLGNLVADLIQAGARSSDGTVAAFTNGGGLRADIVAGTVTFGAALSVLPFGNTLYAMDLTGQDLIDLAEASVSKLGGGGFLQVSRELRMSYCATASGCGTPLKTGGRVISLTVGGQPVSVTRVYRVATNNFTAGGGDGYPVLADACKRQGNYCRDTGIVLLDLLVDELKQRSPINATTDGRITRLQPAS